MNFETYLEQAMRTNLSPEQYAVVATRLQDRDTIQLLHGAMGCTTELGELMDILKRHFFYGTPLDWEHLENELGDYFWYTALILFVISDRTGTSYLEILQRNIEKLKTRFPDKFSEKDALLRVDKEFYK